MATMISVVATMCGPSTWKAELAESDKVRYGVTTIAEGETMPEALSRLGKAVQASFVPPSASVAEQLQAGLDKHGYAKVDLNKPQEG